MATTTIPERIELEYMLDQRRLMRELEAGGGDLNTRKLRRKLLRIGHTLLREKVAEVSAVLGRRVPVPNTSVIDKWVESETEATLAMVQEHRQRADGFIDDIRRMVSEQREARASSAILSLNAELIEEVSRNGGASHYRWQTQMDSRVRPNHEVLNGTVHDWDKPPAGGGTKPGDPGHPGSGYGCRCIPIPIHGVKRTPARVTAEPASKPEQDLTVAAVSNPRNLAVTKAVPPQPYDPRYKINKALINTEAKIKAIERTHGYPKRGPLNTVTTLEQAENAIAGLSKEHGAFFDSNGNMVMKIGGSTAKVHLKFEQMGYAREFVTSFTHNHPSGNAMLSAGDILAAAEARLGEVRAVTRGGYRGGSRLVVTDPQKWALASAPSHRASFQHDIRVMQARSLLKSQSAAKGLEANPEAWKRKANEVFYEEAVKNYNEIGQEYGFRIEPI